jgi:hypothetical protein
VWITAREVDQNEEEDEEENEDEWKERERAGLADARRQLID